MKKTVGLALLLSATALMQAAKSAPDIMYCDVFGAMRQCKKGQEIAKELDEFRGRLSKEIEADAKLLAENEKDLKAKASTMKREALEKEERKLAKQRRDLEDKVRDGEEELKMTMNQKTEALAIEVEKNIAEMARMRGYNRIVDVITGRTICCIDDTDDVTTDVIKYLNEKATDKDKTAAA